MNPNEYQPQQPQTNQVPPQPQQPQPVVSNNSPYPAQPTAPAQPGQPNFAQQPMAQPAGNAPPGKNRKMLIIIGIVVLLLVVGVIALVSLKGKKNPTPSTNGSTSSSTSSSSSSTSTSKNACQLFTLSDAQSAIGSDASTGQAQPPQSKNNNTESICIYSSNSNSLTIAAEVATNSAGSSYQESEFSKSLAVSGTTSVSGLGDKALYGQPTSGGEEIEVIKGNVLFAISANSGSQSTLTPMAQTILNNF